MIGFQFALPIYIFAVLLQLCSAEVTYSYTEGSNLIPTKTSEIHGDGSGDIKMFGSGVQIAVGDVANHQVVVYQKDYFFVEGGSSSSVWTEQAVLVAEEGAPGSGGTSNGVGFAVDAFDDILMASAPVSGNNDYGGVFVYRDNVNDQWTQMQNLQPIKKTIDALFGYDVSIDNNGTRAIIGEPENDYIRTNAGAAYIFGSVNGDKKTYWTQLQELYPENGAASSYFGSRVEIFGKYAAVASPASCEVG
jgi:hypothetical protein